jgi:prepilin-type N-terminal cleavage/methylation domain-containing protein
VKPQRRGFTLIEVMLALVISSVVVTLGYSTLQAGMDVEGRIARARERDQYMTAMRAMLGDALRHAVTGDASPAQRLHTESGADGHTTLLSFVSRGIVAPHGGTAPWFVTLSTDTAGVTFVARAVDGGAVPLQMQVSNARALAVRFKAREDLDWQPTWDDAARLPLAIEVRFLDRDGRDAVAPVVARTSPVGAS